jgi:hypothetical protein
MPIILATQEAEVRRTAVQSQPKQTVCEILSQKQNKTKQNHHKKRLVEWLQV